MTNIQTECIALQGNKHEYASGLVACIRTECIKLRRAPIWLAFAGLPAAATLIGSANYGGNLGELTPGWEALWSQQTLFLCYFFLPALIGVGASYLWRLEHEGTNWHELMTQPVPAWCIFGAKLVVGSLFSLVALLSTTVLFCISGYVLGVPGSFPFATVVGEVTLGWCGSLAITAVQLVFSMHIRNFAAPVGMALGGGILGIVATLMGVGSVFAYSLMQVGMNPATFVTLGVHGALVLIAMSVLWVAGACLVGVKWLEHHDIEAR